jgi:hypothetical protein
MQWGRIAPVVALLVVLGGSLAGCGSDGHIRPAGGDTVTSTGCTHYVALETPAERRDAADLVVDAEVTKTDRTVRFQGIYTVYEASVTAVTKGPGHGESLEAGDTIQVVSTSDQCETSNEPVEYFDGDPLGDEGSFRLYLSPTEDDDVWGLVVPGAAEPEQ